MPKVSIVMPAYNEEKHIKESINSILEQNFKDFEIVIVDDKSTDNTIKVIEELQKNEPRIKLIKHQTNKGQAAALNTAIDNAKGKYLSNFDGDDIMIQNRLKKQVEFLDSHSEIDVVYGDMIVMHSDGTIFRVKAIEFTKDPKEILIESSKRDDLDTIRAASQLLDPVERPKFIPGISLMFKRKVFEKCRFDKNIKRSQDYDMWLQIIGRGFKLKRIEMDTFIYRNNTLNQKSKDKDKMKIATKQIIEKLKSGIYFR